MICFSKARFVTSCANTTQLPPLSARPAPEVAVVGRSNCGKSSLINHLTHQKHLVYVSSTPGKTQLINFFSIDNKLLLVDLPGYGFAKVRKGMQENWSKLITTYLETRTTLRLLVLILDARREPSEEDIMMIRFADHQKTPLFFIFSKMDKLNKGERLREEKRLFQSLMDLHLSQPISYLPYSIKEGDCRTLLQKHLSSLCDTHDNITK